MSATRNRAGREGPDPAPSERTPSAPQAVEEPPRRFPGRIAEIALVAVAIAFALILRITLLPFEAEDFTYFYRPWVHYIKGHGGILSLAGSFSDYQPAYLYLLVLTSSLPIPEIWSVKLIPIAGDLALAWFSYRMVRVRFPEGVAAMAAGLGMLFVPTVVLNSSAWGQCDVLFTTALVATLFYASRGRPSAACIAYGVAFSFKLQAVFFAPFLVLAWLRGRFGLRHLALIPAVFFLLLHPALYLGRPLSSLLGIYVGQTQTYKFLQMRAPNPYQWFPHASYDLFAPLGVVVAAVAVLLLLFLLRRGSWAPDDRLWVATALAFVLMVPLLLPAMHERYFYAADVCSVIYAFYYPRRFAVAVVTVLSSLFAYIPYLTSMRPPLPLVAVGLVLNTGVVVFWLVRDATAQRRSATGGEGGAAPPAAPPAHVPPAALTAPPAGWSSMGQ